MNMEERLIYAVSLYPELYNSSLSSYKDYSKKADAWRSVSLQSEAPGKTTLAFIIVLSLHKLHHKYTTFVG